MMKVDGGDEHDGDSYCNGYDDDDGDDDDDKDDDDDDDEEINVDDG